MLSFINFLNYLNDNPNSLSEEQKSNLHNLLFCQTHDLFIISRKSGQKIPKIANLQYYKSKANYGTKKKGISR